MDVVARSNHGQHDFKTVSNGELTKDNEEFENLLDKKSFSKNSSKTSYDISSDHSPPQNSKTNLNKYMTNAEILDQIDNKKVPGPFNWTQKGSIRIFFLMKFLIILLSFFCLLLLIKTSYATKTAHKN